MNAKDLMIGDWYYQEAEGKKYPFQIKAEDFVKDEIVNFRPIPLTAEILEKCGFEQGFWSGHNCLDSHTCLNYNEYEDNEGDFDLFICNGIRKGSKCEEINEFEFTAIRYVHELQHALRLCGIEKEIEL